MSRVLVFSDRLPTDPSWKGACTWEIIRALAEAHHEVTVFTTQSPELIPITHPRLTVARPASSFGVDKMGRWAQAVLALRPEVIHTFALQKSNTWPSLSVWPYLDALCRMLPEVRRVSTLFDREDMRPDQPEAKWHSGSQRWTVFSQSAARLAKNIFSGQVDIAPLEEVFQTTPTDSLESAEKFLFVAAPVSEWLRHESGLTLLADFLTKNKDLRAQINGGWGDLTLSERHKGWQNLIQVSSRVRLLAPQTLDGLLRKVASASGVWVEGVPVDSWRFTLSVQAARVFGKQMLGAREIEPALPCGSTANFLSRLYLH